MLTSAICAAARSLGKIPLYHSNYWPFGVSKAVLCCNFKYRGAIEYNYLISKYDDPLDIAGHASAPEQRKYHYENFHALQHMTDRDRLDLIGHSDGNRICRFYPEDLARELASYSLREIGLIKLQACLTGGTDFIKKFGIALHYHNIRFAFLCAPVGRITWNNPFYKSVEEQNHIKYMTLKGNIDRKFPGTRYDF